MAKIRVYELAKELDKDNKSLVKVIRGLGIPIKNQMSTLTPDEAERVRAEMRGGSSPKQKSTSPSTSNGSTPTPGRKRGGGGGGGAVIRRRSSEVKRRRAERQEQQDAAEQVAARASGSTAPAAAPAEPSPPASRPAVRTRSEAPSSVPSRPAASTRTPSAPPPARPAPPAPSASPAPPRPSASPAPRGVESRPRAPESARPAPQREEPKGSAATPTPSSGSRGATAPKPSSNGPTRREATPPAPEPETPAARRISPEVGTRIELPKGSRRLPGGMASRMEGQGPGQAREIQREQRPGGPPSRGGAPPHRDAGRAEPRREGAPPRPAAEAKGESRPSAEAKDGGVSRVVRNEAGVIVGAASQRSQPKILGFIPLAARTPKRQQVIITDASEEDKRGRATQRKQREERAQAQGRRRKNFRGKGGRHGSSGPPKISTVEMSEEKKRIRVDEAIQVSDLAHQMGQKASLVLRKLWGMGMRGITINNAIDYETADLVASEFGYTVDNVSFQEDVLLEDASPVEGIARAPVVTIMGHVDHGKTSLLDHIRESRVAVGEAGGITQHIGAYKVPTSRGEVVFLDTPGHEAFGAMRSRGAQVTDVVVLVVAADDGVMPTTLEAIKYSREAKVPIVVAINKMDKLEANPGRVKQMLMEQSLVGEEFGGDTSIIEVSAKTGQGIDELLETLSLQAELLELRADVKGRAKGTVLEARIDKGRGTVATVLIQSGTLKKGDIVVANEFHGKARGLFDHTGQPLKEAGPSTPVEILGLSGVPAAGDAFNVVESDKDAKALVAYRREKRKRKESVRTGPSIQELLKRKKTPVLKIVLKADVQGSAQALANALEELSSEKVKVEVLKAEVGMINETDVKYARAGEAVIFGFNVKTTGKAAPVAEAEQVPIHTFSVIYEATDLAKELMVGMLEPEYREREQGEAEVRALFPIPRLGVVAGCRVTKGFIQRSSHVRVVRDGQVLHQGTIASLRVHKDDVREVKDGFECGIVVDGFTEVQEGDRIQAFDVEAIPPTL